jgi:hypothetical protein
MKDAKQELEQEFLKTPTLKYVGMALMQYAESFFSPSGSSLILPRRAGSGRMLCRRGDV